MTAKDYKPRCPAEDCRAPTSPQLSASEQLTAAGVGALWVEFARRCSHCGCVYVGRRPSAVIKGYLGNEVLGERWKPTGTG